VTETAAPSVAPTTGSDAFPEARLIEAYRTMVLARALDERCITLQRQGRIGFYAPHSGQEAALVGSAFALGPDDWIFPSYRELTVALVRGVPLGAVVDQIYGNARDTSRGRQMPNHFAFVDQHFVSASSPIGTQITQAVGAAMAAQRRKASMVAITYFGDGATSSNDFHAGLNFAGVFGAPVVFFCQNNEYAISLPRERQTRSSTLAEKAESYGFHGVVVDGNDLTAVYSAVWNARRRALEGGGPTLIEAQVYRLGPHSTSDDPHRYRPDAEVAVARQKDPLLRAKAALLAGGRLDEPADAKLWEDARAAISQAITAAEAAPPLDRLSIFEDVFASIPDRLEAERRECAALPPQEMHRP
jgi:pyruvate dehydrogenase E1 component subunit alpha